MASASGAPEADAQIASWITRTTRAHRSAADLRSYSKIELKIDLKMVQIWTQNRLQNRPKISSKTGAVLEAKILVFRWFTTGACASCYCSFYSFYLCSFLLLFFTLFVFLFVCSYCIRLFLFDIIVYCIIILYYSIFTFIRTL